MKKAKISFSCCLAIFGIAGLLCSCQSPKTVDPNGVNHQGQLYGHLYNKDGTPAVNAKVTIIRSSYIPTSSLPKMTLTGASGTVSATNTAEGVTDKNGLYSFSYVPADTYNILGEGNGNVSRIDSIIVASDTTQIKVPNDTLLPPCSIKGIISCDPPADSRKILISLPGTNIVCWADDSAGHFTINNIPSYVITFYGDQYFSTPRTSVYLKFTPTDPNYLDSDLWVNIYPGKTTDIGTIISKKWNYGPVGALRQNYLSMKFGIMVHFNMSTFSRDTCANCYSVSGEWGRGNEADSAEEFKPTSLNCGQWADAAKAAGAKYMILTVKYQDGFCLWPSKYTEYCMKNAAVTTDVVKEFADSARSRGLQIGLYYSIRDLSNGYSMDFIKSQLTELLSNYGTISCMWFDGWGWGPGYKTVPFTTIDSTVKSLQPNCLVIDNNHEYSLHNSEMSEYEVPIDGLVPASNRYPAEAFEPIRLETPQFKPLWFWHPVGNCEIMSPQSIVDRIQQCNSRNANYMLDVTPDTTGQIPQCQVECLKSVGTLRGIQ